jgi:hypothetical protein
VEDGDHYLRAALAEQLAIDRGPAPGRLPFQFGFYVQLQADPETMPIEDPTRRWASPWEQVATIEIPAQDFNFPDREAWGEGLSYTPWHTLKDHRPLGGINRARKAVYLVSSNLRHDNSGVWRKEPTEADIPGLVFSERQEFYHLPEGSEFYPLDWLKALRAEDGGTPFLNHPERFGLIPDPKDEDGLPVGMSAHTPRDFTDLAAIAKTSATAKDPGGPVAATAEYLGGIKMVGITCAGCHVGELTRRGKEVRLDGAPNLVDINALFRELLKTTEATIRDRTRFEEFCEELQKQKGEGARQAARLFAATTQLLSERGQVGKPGSGATVKLLSSLEHPHSPVGHVFRDLEQEEKDKIIEAAGLLSARLDYLRGLREVHEGEPTTDPGPGRLDAFVNGRNIIFQNDHITANSPVSFPHLWQVRQTVWFHWDGNTNSFMERNIGQAIGLGAVYVATKFESLVLPGNLHTLEQRTRRIVPPRWPADVMGGGVDREKADRGEAIFRERCIACHAILRGPEDRAPDLVVPVELIGTDPKRAENFAQRLTDGQDFAIRLGAVARGIKEKWYCEMCISDSDRSKMEPAGEVVWRTTRGYVARPLTAIWATAPYLHNGSVPTLHDLFLPADQRPKTFPVGHREYDPIRLGYVTEEEQIPKDQRRWIFDTTRDGNHNTGHDGHVYGTDLTVEEREALLEYLKGT